MLGFLQFWGFLWPWKLTLIGHWMNFNSPIFFPWWLKAIFFTRCLYFHRNWSKEKDLIEKKNVEIYKYSYLSIIWIFKKMSSLKSNCFTNYLQNKTTFGAKLSHSITRTLIALNRFVSSLCFSSDLSYWES